VLRSCESDERGLRASLRDVLAAALAANQQLTRLAADLREENARLRAENAVVGAVASGCRQEMAAFTSSMTLFSTTGLHSWRAYDTGHMPPSSRFAASWKPRVQYR
jgi:hypothetical protein